MLRGPMYKPAVLSTPLRSNLFLEKHRLLQPDWETCAETRFTLRGSKSFHQKIKEITPTTVWAGRGNLRELVLTGSCVAFQRQPQERHRVSRVVQWTDPIVPKAEFWDKMCLIHKWDHLHIRSVAPAIPQLACKPQIHQDKEGFSSLPYMST